MNLKKILILTGLIGLTISCSNINTRDTQAKERAMMYAKFKDNVKIVDFYEFKTLLDGITEKENKELSVYEMSINGNTYLVNKVSDKEYKKQISNKIVNFQNDEKIIQIDYGMSVLPRIDGNNIIQGAFIFLDGDNRIRQIEKHINQKILAKSKTRKILVTPIDFANTLEKGMIINNLK